MKIADGTVTLTSPEEGTVVLRAYGADVDVSRDLADAYRIVERDTRESPACFVASFSDETGSGIEITVVPSGEPAAAEIIG
jgi:hypothetical protein